jgi:CO dehydrogenase maturation factor
VGKTTLTAWLGDYLARQGQSPWLVDADTALSLGAALGLPDAALPTPLIQDETLIRERVGKGFINLNPDVSDLPERLRVRLGNISLLIMGSVAGAGGGCACEANALLKSLLAHLLLDRDQCLLVDLEAGVEHLGRGTVAAVDGLIVTAEPSWRSLAVAAQVATMAAELGLTRQVCPQPGAVLHRPARPGRLPPLLHHSDAFQLAERQLTLPSVWACPTRCR